MEPQKQAASNAPFATYDNNHAHRWQTPVQGQDFEKSQQSGHWHDTTRVPGVKLKEPPKLGATQTAFKSVPTILFAKMKGR